MIKDHMARSGDFLFRWRSFLPLIFTPAIVWSASHGEPLEAVLGEPWGDVYEIAAILVVVAGALIRILTVGFVPAGTSGRNTHGQVASVLNTTGFYSVCRNPLYLGNCMMYLGAALFTQDLTLTAIMALTLALYYERIISAEEAFLSEKFGQDYRDWVATTPAFFPRFSNWRAPNMTFSLITVIRREQSTLLAAVIVVAAIALGQDYADTRETQLEFGWVWAVGAALVIFILLNVLKRSGRLEVRGR